MSVGLAFVGVKYTSNFERFDGESLLKFVKIVDVFASKGEALSDKVRSAGVCVIIGSVKDKSSGVRIELPNRDEQSLSTLEGLPDSAAFPGFPGCLHCFSAYPLAVSITPNM